MLSLGHGAWAILLAPIIVGLIDFKSLGYSVLFVVVLVFAFAR